MFPPFSPSREVLAPFLIDLLNNAESLLLLPWQRLSKPTQAFFCDFDAFTAQAE
jgi:hypothetical protein